MVLIWDLMLSFISNQHKMLKESLILPYQKREIAKKKFLVGHAF